MRNLVALALPVCVLLVGLVCLFVADAAPATGVVFVPLGGALLLGATVLFMWTDARSLTLWRRERGLE